jgi:hypothetical protein
VIVRDGPPPAAPAKLRPATVVPDTLGALALGPGKSAWLDLQDMRRDGAGFRASGSSATVAAKRSGPGRVAELDGIRALAIWAVLLFHGISTADSAEAAGALSAGPRALFTLVAHGWLGVDLFFVLSGVSDHRHPA